MRGSMSQDPCGMRAEGPGSGLALLAAAAAVLAATAHELREKHQEAELTVQNIHDQPDALDPATPAAVIARLTSDEVHKVRDHHQ